jgi:hypothetical protein
MWKKRSTGKQKQRAIARATNYKQTLQELLAHPDHKSGVIRYEQCRKMAAVILTKTADAVVQQLLAMAPDLRDRTKTIYEDWLKEKDRQALDPTYVPSVDGDIAPADSLQYLDEVIQGILNMFFICRRRECLFFSRNTTWIPNERESRWLCPCCGERYRPGVTGGGLIKAQFILVFNVGASVHYMLAEWPESAEMGWINKQMETCAGLTEADRSLSQEQLKEKIKEITESKSLPFEWDVFHISPSTRARVNELNRVQPEEGWNMEVVNKLATGFQGAQLELKEPMPVLLQDDFIRLINLCGLFHRRNMAKMRCKF